MHHHDRRRFLLRLSALGLGSLACGPRSTRSDSRFGFGSGEILLSAHGTTAEEYGLVAQGRDEPPRIVPAGFRGHDVAIHPVRRQEVLLFGRRPGLETLVVDIEAAQTTARLVAPPSRAFQGHGCFSEDGATLFTSEADVHTGAGYLGVWDAATWQRIGELSSQGIGPHQIGMLPQDRSLVVANGGLLTRPETGRRVLNLDTMESSLTYIDPIDGRVTDVARVREPKASIRHFDIAEDGTVAFGVQLQRPAMNHDRVVSIGGVHRWGADVVEIEDRLDVMAVFEDYVGSVAIGGRTVGFTSPRGNVAAFWDLDHGHFVGAHQLADVCGLAASADGLRFILTSSIGEVRALRAFDGSELRSERRRDERVAWDNHCRILEGSELERS